jgi:deazaflavin-dependent oxidoreductase (nitroreductase family)
VTDAIHLETFAGEPYAYLTTIGRRTGEPHRIEIWFAVHDGRVYLMSGGRDRADWVRNVMANGQVRFEVGGETYAGSARVVSADEDDDRLARELLVARYATTEDPLADWKKRSLPVVIEFPDAGAGRSQEEGSAR